MAQSTKNTARALAHPKQARWPKWLNPSESGIMFALAAIWIFLAVSTFVTGAPTFFTPGNIGNILYQTSFIAIVSVTMTIVLVSGNFDLSVGATAALCGASVLLLTEVVGVYPAIALALAIGAGVGLFNGMVVQGLGVNAFIVTLGTMTALRGLLLVITGGKTASASDRSMIVDLRAIENGFWTSPNLFWIAAVIALVAAAIYAWRRRGRIVWILAGLGILFGIAGFVWNAEWRLAKPVYYMVAIVGTAWFVTQFTIVGRRLQATGANVEAARLSGVNVPLYKIVPFILNGLAAAVVGLLYAGRIGSVLPDALPGLELTAIAAAILGGTSLYGGSGNVLNTLAGAMVLFSLVNGFDIFGLGSSYQSLIEGIVLIVAAAIYTIGSRRK